MSFFDGLLGVFSNDLAIDLGTANTLVYVKGKGKVTVIVLFVLNEQGEMENLKLENSSGLKEYDEMILRTIKKIKNKWKPATLHGVPIKFLFRMPLSFSTDTI